MVPDDEKRCADCGGPIDSASRCERCWDLHNHIDEWRRSKCLNCGYWVTLSVQGGCRLHRHNWGAVEDPACPDWAAA